MIQGVTKKYYDILNNSKIEELKTIVQNINNRYKSIANDQSVANRENTNYEVYVQQYLNDMQNISDMRKFAADLIDICDDINFIISKKSLDNHLFGFSE